MTDLISAASQSPRPLFVLKGQDVQRLEVPYRADFYEADGTDAQNREGMADFLSDLFVERHTYPAELTRSRDDGLELEPLDVVIRFQGAAGRPLLLPDTFRTSYLYGGCDEHPGRCHIGCELWDTKLRWDLVKQETRGEDLWAVFSGEQA